MTVLNSDFRVRVIDLETAGNGKNDVCEIGWQDVGLGPDGRWRIEQERGALMVNPGRPIAVETMAIYHIVDADVATAPYWRQVASSILRPGAGVKLLTAHRSAFEQRYCTPGLTGGSPWICTWKCSMRLWPQLTSFSNQMLRYQRVPVGLDRDIGLPAHRAMPDAYVTAHRLRDMLNEVSIDQLVAWSLEPGSLPRVPSGAERGKTWDRLSVEMLREMSLARDPDIKFSAETELSRRGEKELVVVVGPSQGRLF
ncbi:DNA polymerase III subunit epsilon [Rhizobium grahamii]|uniref:Exonuclease RNase T and DNA polymerase III n=1 Tax=Rhizobium grahamii CCGE 502 TaxID=990285 RepID=S3I5M4_9HYPH|nr:DNA polymerase III subunit epsilon [Rhizobium grahamii]EPE94833.1 Exonuclease RNase T and DNA polymerase III [Rhizobium grahamii CCGE 502]